MSSALKRVRANRSGQSVIGAATASNIIFLVSWSSRGLGIFRAMSQSRTIQVNLSRSYDRTSFQNSNARLNPSRVVSLTYSRPHSRTQKETRLQPRSVTPHLSQISFFPDFVTMAAQPDRPRLPKIRFRVLVIGRANAGKTSILKRVCETTDSPEIYRLDPSGNRQRVRPRPQNLKCFRSHCLARSN